MTSPNQNVATSDLGGGTLGLKVCWKKFKFQDLNPLPYLALDFKKKGCNMIFKLRRFQPLGHLGNGLRAFTSVGV